MATAAARQFESRLAFRQKWRNKLADQHDLEHLESGSLDLVNCVLRGADLSMRDLSERDFRRANLTDANLSKSLLRKTNFSDASLHRARFVDSDLTGSRFSGFVLGVDFTGSSLRDSKMLGAFTKCDFSNANLIGADFRMANIGEGCRFSGAIVDKSTNFSGAKALRIYLNEDVFRNYTIERGTLIPRGEGEIEENAATSIQRAVSALEEGIRVVSEQPTAAERTEAIAAIGHNQPPSEFQLSEDERASSLSAFTEARESLLSDEIERSKLRKAMEAAWRLSTRALSYIGGHADTTLDAFSKSFGTTLGSKSAMFLSAAYFSGTMERVVEALLRVLGV